MILCGCKDATHTVVENKETTAPLLSLAILGTIQDAGSPHIGCEKKCCLGLFNQEDPSRKVVSLGLIDNLYKETYLFEATPDMTTQLKELKNQAGYKAAKLPDGIFLTHAHIGHYTGLMYLGKEAINAPSVPVYAMPQMKTFLETNGPWSQLVSNKNISIKPIYNNQPISLNKHLMVTPLRVPHRDEFSETVGYRIAGPHKKALFIPDIDKWEKWEKDIIQEIAQVDYAFLDATFYSGAEINNRDISQIPHPFIIESMERLKNLPKAEKNKIIFIHFNHTNPVINKQSDAYQTVIDSGFKVAQIYDRYEL